MNFSDLKRVLDNEELTPDGAKRLSPFVEFFATDSSLASFLDQILSDNFDSSNFYLAQNLYAKAQEHNNEAGLKVIEEFFSQRIIRPAIKAYSVRVMNGIADLDSADLEEKGTIDEEGAEPPLYKEFLRICTLREKIKGISSDISKRALVAATFFDSIEEVDTYLMASVPGKPSHTFLTFTLPETGEWDKAFWKNMALTHGYAVTQYLSYAPQIEAEMKKLEVSKSPLPSLETLEGLIFDLFYERGSKHPDAAKIGIKIGLTQTQFDTTILRLKSASETDKTPEIEIKGVDLDLPGYDLRKVSKDDPIYLSHSSISNLEERVRAFGVTSRSMKSGENQIAGSHELEAVFDADRMTRNASGQDMADAIINAVRSMEVMILKSL